MAKNTQAPTQTTVALTQTEAAQADLLERALRQETINRTQRKTLNRFVAEGSPEFDAKFAKVIALLAPQWFETIPTRFGDAEHNKLALLMAAQAGWTKPSRKTRLGQVLSTYTSTGHDRYDRLFVTRLTSLRPEWLQNRRIANAAA